MSLDERIESLMGMGLDQKCWALAGLVFMALFVVGWKVFIGPDMAALKTMRLQTADARSTRSALDELTTLKAGLDQYRGDLSPGAEPDWLIDVANRLAGEAGITLLSVSPQSASLAQAKGFLYQPVSLTLEAEGGYHKIGRFVEKLENHRPMIRLQSLHMNLQKNSAGQPVLRSEMTISAFYPAEPAQ